MRFTRRPVASLGVLAAAAATGLMTAPAANAHTDAGQGTAVQAPAGSLHAWRGYPGGPPDQVFDGFECQKTDYRYQAWKVVSDGPPELWMGFNDPNCEDASGFFNPGGEPEFRHGVGSVQRFR
ncbi:hypothetical protein ACH35V_33410 [Actinomadura sp. 1N219]|uniref:hypothetical protein n=1 Tax=Actinomadura sp. 1N219 TaxID=3375152 RepID=UPI0037A0BE08